MMRLRNIGLGLVVGLVGWAGQAFAQFNPQPQSITDKYFPDPSESFPTPAFAKEKGFTTLDEMKAWLTNLAETTKGKSGGVTMSQSIIGKSQKGKDMVLLRFSKAGGTNDKVRVWLQGGLHGDEPAGTEAMLYVAHCLMTNTDWQRLLDKLDVMMLPMANVDGYEALRRESANGTDLNRDQTKISAPETEYIKAAFSAFAPDVALDFHEFRPFRKDFARMSSAGVTTLHDAMFLYTGNLNVPLSIRKFTEQHFVNPAKAALNQQGLRNCNYVTTEKVGGQVQFNLGSIHARSSASNYALTGAISTLFEIRGVGIGRTSFKRRVQASYLLAQSYLKSAYDQADSIKLVLKQAERLRNPVVVKTERRRYKDSLQFIDLSTERVIPLRVIINSALEGKPLLTRVRPSAYLLSSSEKRAVKNLKLLGLLVDSLAQEKELEVEAFKNLESTEAEEPTTDNEESGLAQSSASTVIITQKFPVGTYVVWLDQRRANLVCEVLEPENPNGFVAMKVIKDKNGNLPIYRYLKSERP